MREKLIDNVHSELMGLLQRTPYIRCEDVNRQYAVNWLMNNGVTVQKWIPVTERLPEYGEIVLAFGKRHATSGMFRGTTSKPNWWHWKGNTYKDVSHWMPLPEPPKENE
jgi:hypothetical protein